MATNISKYIQLNDFLLLEYEFNKDGAVTSLTDPYVIDTCLGTKYFYEGDGALGGTNNILSLNSVPTNTGRTSWVFDSSNSFVTYSAYWDSSTKIPDSTYPMDTIKVHIISGYNFDDIGGFLLQVRAIDVSDNLVDLANFTYGKQEDIITGDVISFSSNTLFLGNKFYDKYFQFQVPSIQELGNNSPVTTLGNVLNVTSLSDVYMTYSTIFDILNYEYILDEQVSVQIPVTSAADNFSCYIAESTAGDFIEYYATWNGSMIGDYIGDIESGIIPLYTSNNPNDNYTEFSETYGTSARKWVIIHEITLYEHIPGASLLTQKYSFTQTDNFATANYFRPIIRNSDIASSYTIQYVCRLTNRMDGTQIIRKASFSSADPKKYGLKFSRLNADNLIPYKVFNKVEDEKANVLTRSDLQKTKYVKVFYDTSNILLNAFNEVFPSGTGPLFLKSYDSIYKFKFEKIDTKGNRVNIDLSGAYNYALVFKLDDNTKIEVGPTYSTNMNTAIGEIEFKLTENQLDTLKKQKNNDFSIVVKNPNGTSYVFYEGNYYNLSDQDQVIANYQDLYSVTDLQARVAELESEVNRLEDENAELKTT